LNNGDHAEVAKDMTCCSDKCTGKHGFLEDPEDGEFDFRLTFASGFGFKTSCVFHAEELKLWEDHI